MAADDDGAIDTNEEAQQYQYPEYGAGIAPSQDDNSGAAPTVAAPADNSGAAPVADSAGAIDTGDQELPRTGPNGPIARGIKGIVSYLMGAGAAHPDVLDQSAAQADPQGAMSPGDRNIMAIDKAAQQGGPKAAWQLVQANRVAYNAKQAFAYAALNGSQQKPADLNSAIQAANQAADHILDGSDVNFAPSQGGGVTATVTAPGQTQPQVFNLNPDQFREYLNVGRTGQWDRLMQDGIPGTLQKIASGANHQRSAPPRPQAQAPQQAPQAPQSTPQPRQTNFGQTPSTMNLSGNQDAIPDSATQDRTEYDPRLTARADRMFPGITQQAQRDQWLAAQEQREDELQNKVDVAKETGENRVRAARETGNARVQAGDRAAQSRENVQKDKTAGWKYASDAKTRSAQIASDGKLASQGNKEAHDRMETARKTIAALRATGNNLTPEQVETEKQLSQVPQGRPQPGAQGQTQQAPQQAAPQQKPPVQGAKLYKGQWYTRGPNGESVPVQ